MMQLGKRLPGWTLLLLVMAFTLSTGTAWAGDDDKATTLTASSTSPSLASGTTVKKAKGEGGGHRLSVPVVDTDFLGMADWTRNQIRAPQAHTIATGAGITVAVLDGGFNLAHPDIEGNLATVHYDAIDNDFDVSDDGNGIDDDGDGFVDSGLGHGTFVAGMVLMAAPDATILPIRVRDDEGWGSNYELERGIVYAVKLGADVINISGGAYEPDVAELALLIGDVRDMGIPIIVSSGNGGHSQLHGLAELPDVLPVGAVDMNDNTVDWSDYARSDDMVCAPGDVVYGPLGFPLVTDSGYWSGTSFSAGLVSGAAALALDVDDALSVSEVFEALLDSTDDVFDADSGHAVSNLGRLDLYEVVTWDD